MDATEHKRVAFGRLLRRLRKERGLTQDALAHYVAYAIDTIKKVEQGIRSPSHQLAASLADGLNLHDAEREQFLAAAHQASVIPTMSQPLGDGGEGCANTQLPVTPLIGRKEEVAALTHLVSSSEHRLVTILGLGGMGKTRLAVEVARTAKSVFPEGVYFITLGSLSTSTSIAHRIAEVVQLPVQPDARSILQQLLAYLRPKQCLLVLDNFEHLLPDGAGLVNELLQACPRVHLLVTSRERLLLSNEIIYALKHLPFPTWETPHDVLHYDAVQLFIETARRVRRDMLFTADALQFVARICRLVEGMPLGIILAATQADVLPVSDIAAELLYSYDFLSVELADLPDRQRSLRAVITSSWMRLDEDARVGFAKLSVFRGGFTRAAAQAIASMPLSILTRLVHASFVQRTGDRFVLHELLRQYGEDQLQRGESILQVCDAHSHYFLTFVGKRQHELAGAAQVRALAELRSELQNIRAAWYRAVQQHNYAGIDNALHGIFRWFWLDRSQQEDGFAMLRQALKHWEQVEGPEAAYVRARIAARLLPIEGPWLKDGAAALERLCEALDLARARVDEAEIAFCRWGMGFALVSILDDVSELDKLSRAAECYRQSLVYYEAHDDVGWAAQVREHLGHCYRRMKHYDAAVVVLRESLAARRAFGDQFGRARCSRELGFVAYLLGSTAEAESAWNEAYTISNELGDMYGVMDSLFFLTVLALTCGEWARARQMIAHVFELAEQGQSELYQGWCIRSQEMIVAMEHVAGAPSAQTSVFPNEHSQFTAQLFFLLYGRNLKYQLKRILDVASSDIEQAALLPFVAHVLKQQGEMYAATQMLSLAHQYSDITGSWLVRLPEIVGLHTVLVAALGPDEFQRNWEAGMNLSLNTAIGVVHSHL